MKFLLPLIASLFFSLNLIAADLKAELSLMTTSGVLKEGDLVEGLLKVWPIENVELEQFKQLENMPLGNFVVTEIESAEVSANNADVVEVLLLLAVKPSKSSSAELNYKGQAITILLPAIPIQELKKEQNEYFVMDQGLLDSQFLKMAAIASMGLLLTISIWKRKNIKSWISKLKTDPIAIATKKFNDLFMLATTRQDYEEIYALRKNWLSLNKVPAQAYSEFFKKMELHQYKESWNAQDLDEVKNSFDIIRGSFK